MVDALRDIPDAATPVDIQQECTILKRENFLLTQLVASLGRESVLKDSKIAALEAEVKKLTHETTDNIVTVSRPTSSGSIRKTYSDIVARNDLRENSIPHQPAIVIKPKEKTQNSGKTKKAIKDSIKPDVMKLGVSMMRGGRDGGVIIGCQDEATLTTLRDTAKEVLGSDYSVEYPRKRKPRLMISGVDVEHVAEEVNLKDMITNQNNLDAHSTDIKVIHKGTENKLGLVNIVIEVSPVTRKQLLRNNKLNIGWRRCNIRDYVYIKRCYRCQAFGHYAKDCSRDVLCGFCGGPHKYSDCTSDVVSCANCCTANVLHNLKYDCKHQAINRDCPSYQRILNSERQKIDYEVL